MLQTGGMPGRDTGKTQMGIAWILESAYHLLDQVSSVRCACYKCRLRVCTGKVILQRLSR